MAKIFIVLGVTFLVVGLLLYFFESFSLFRLPGDIVIQKENFTFYFPITSSILLSLLFSFIFYLFSKF